MLRVSIILLTFLIILSACEKPVSPPLRRNRRQKKQAAQSALPLKIGGFDPQSLSPSLEDKQSHFDRAGGTLNLDRGVKVQIPEGATETKLRLRCRLLKSQGDDSLALHLESSAPELKKAATIAVPVPKKYRAKNFTVTALHFRSEDDQGRALAVQWKAGEPEARVETKRFSIVMFLFGVAIGTEFVAQRRNLEGRLTKAVSESLLKFGSKRSPINLPYYSKGDQLWCWAAGISMAAEGVCPLPEKLENPLTPQRIATFTNHGNSGLFAARYWLLSAVEPWRSTALHCKRLIGVKRFIHFDKLVRYIIRSLSRGYPVILDINAMTHTLVLVGYDAKGLFVQDPDYVNMTVGYIPWKNFFGILKYSLSKAISGAHTAVIARKPCLKSSLSINVPNAAISLSKKSLFNRNGCYFTTAHQKKEDMKHAGFRWSGKNPRGLGFELVTGGAQKTIIKYPFIVGGQTKIGLRNIEIANVSQDAKKCRIEVDLWDVKKKESVAVKEAELRVMSGQKIGFPKYMTRGWGSVFQFNSVEIPLLTLLPKDQLNARDFLIRFTLLEKQAPVDRVIIPVNLQPLRIDKISVKETATGQVQYSLVGTGFDMKGIEPLIVYSQLNKRRTSQLPENEVVFSIQGKTRATVTVNPSKVPLGIAFITPEDLESNIAMPEVTCRYLRLSWSFSGPGFRLKKGKDSETDTTVSFYLWPKTQIPISLWQKRFHGKLEMNNSSVGQRVRGTQKRTISVEGQIGNDLSTVEKLIVTMTDSHTVRAKDFSSRRHISWFLKTKTLPRITSTKRDPSSAYFRRRYQEDDLEEFEFQIRDSYYKAEKGEAKPRLLKQLRMGHRNKLDSPKHSGVVKVFIDSKPKWPIKK